MSPAAVHPKTRAAIGGGGLLAAVQAALTSSTALHLSTLETGIITTIAAGVAAWLAPSPQ